MEEALREAQAAYPQETGGLLLGWSTRPGSVVITRIVGPGLQAIHRATSFVPNAAWQESQVADAYREAGRRVHYLGDWHTHPRGPFD